MLVCKICGNTNNDVKFYENYKSICSICYNIKNKQRKIKKLTTKQQGFEIIRLYRSYNKDIHVISRIFKCCEQDIIDYLKLAGYYDKNSKRCGKCGIIKENKDFAKHQQNPSGWCKKCINEYNTKYYDENSDTLKENTSLYYFCNIDECKKRQKNYQKNNQEYLKIKRKEYREANVDKIKQYLRDYYEENKESLIDYQYCYRFNNRALSNFWKSKYRANKLKAIPKWANFDKIKEFYNLAEKLTNETGILHTVDHIIPLQNNMVCGLHTHDNLQILTGSENSQKSNKFNPQFNF